jgi:hypothetical protein
MIDRTRGAVRLNCRNHPMIYMSSMTYVLQTCARPAEPIHSKRDATTNPNPDFIQPSNFLVMPSDGDGDTFGRGRWTQLGQNSGPQGWLAGKKIKLGWLKNFQPSVHHVLGSSPAPYPSVTGLSIRTTFYTDVNPSTTVFCMLGRWRWR